MAFSQKTLYAVVHRFNNLDGVDSASFSTAHSFGDMSKDLDNLKGRINHRWNQILSFQSLGPTKTGGKF